ncbi:MAG: HAD-IIA family hydrolase [Melioribacteraceae bacterium]|nr:HAD-IIA family hydrolase [Melioribacteraceae bacterium]
MTSLSEKYKGFIFDMDGTIYLEDKMINGAVETLNYLIKKNKHILFVTNKTTQTKEEYAEFLNMNGVAISSDQILTAASNCVSYLKRERQNKKFYAIAEDVLINNVKDAGLIFTENPNEIDVLIISLDRNYSPQKFEIAKNALTNGAEFFAANIDNTCPVIKGEIVDAGIVISDLESATGKKLIQHFGKPSEFMISTIKRNLKFSVKDYLLIGDRLETDILMGNKIGIDTVLVNSGVANKLDNPTCSATFHVNSIEEIL